jgi:hypothetical protein
MRRVKPNTESGIKPDIVLANGTRLRSLPWGGPQCAGMGIRIWHGGFEVVDLHPGTMEPFESTRADRFHELADAAAWAIYQTRRMNASLFGLPDPAEPAVTPIETPEPAPVLPKRTNPRSRLTITAS